MSYFVRRINHNGLPVHLLIEARLQQVTMPDGQTGQQMVESTVAMGAGMTELDAAISLAQEVQGAMVQTGNNVIDASRDERRLVGEREADALPHLKRKKVGEPGSGHGGDPEPN